RRRGRRGRGGERGDRPQQGAARQTAERANEAPDHGDERVTQPRPIVEGGGVSESPPPISREPSPARAFEADLRDEGPIAPFVPAPPAQLTVDVPPVDLPRPTPQRQDARESEPTPIAFVASVMQAETHAVPRNAPPIPPVSRELPPDSDLVLVETRSVSTSASEDTDTSAPKPKRVRPPRVENA